MSVDVMLREAPPAPALAPPAEFRRQPGFVTVEEYFQIAESSVAKVEYIDGAIIEMPRVKRNHIDIQANVSDELYAQIDLRQNRIYSSDVTVRQDLAAYVNPDLVVARRPVRFADNDIDLLNPALAVEVHSESTRDHDLIRKLPRYLAMPGLEHILYIEQDRVSVTHHKRVDGDWTMREYTDLDDIVELDSLDASLALARVYHDVVFG